jgi:hypothetical protein
MSYTMQDLATFIQRNGWRGSSSADNEQLYRFINNSIQRLASMRDWPAYRKHFFVPLTAPYTTGTVALTAGSGSVVGTDTVWASTMVGQEFYVGADGNRQYRVTAVADTTNLTIEPLYMGSATASTTYAIRYVRYAMASDFDRPRGGLFDEYGRELTLLEVSTDDYFGLRVQNNQSASLPTHVMWDNGGPGQDSTRYLYVHPAPSGSHLLRGSYQAIPVTGTTVTDPDWPERFLYLIHEMLRMELSVQENRGANPAMMGKFERLVDEAYRRDSQRTGPITIKTGKRSVYDHIGEFRATHRIVE